MLFERKRVGAAGRATAWLLILVAAGGVASALDAMVVEPELRLSLTGLRLPVSHGGRLGRCLGDARIVQLSDLHVRGWGLRERRLAGRLRQLRPDMLVMTGDYGEGPDGLAALTRLLGPVKPPLGAYGVLGNNDHYRGEREQIVAALRAAGVTVLVNAAATVSARGGEFAVAGVDDPHYGRDDITAAMAGLPPDLPVVLLSHSPDLLRRKSRGLLINAGDERGPWRRGWFWQDGAHVRPDPGEVIFPVTGKRRLRVVRREDGVGVEEIRLLPVAADGGAGGGKAGPPRRRGRKNMREPGHVPGEIVIKAGRIRDADVHGEGWVRRMTEEGETLFSVPDRGIIQSWVDVEPDSYFEAEFEATGGVRYHVWVRLKSANDAGTSDSLYLQFTDSLNAEGKPDYRIGVAVPEVDTERIDLMLAGHEHGGQVRLPWFGPLEPNVRLSPYQMGLYRAGPMPLFVSRGVGWSALPVRFFCPPEVVVIDAGARGGKSEGDDVGTL